jgi:hypothetical protein
LLLNLSFLLALICSELLVIYQVCINVRVYWVIVKDSLLLEGLLKCSNHLIERLAVLVILLALVTHDLTNGNGEDTDELAREALENLVVDSASHCWRVKVVHRHWHTEADDCIDGRIGT